MEKRGTCLIHSILAAELKVTSFEFLEWNPGHHSLPVLILTSFVVFPHFHLS